MLVESRKWDWWKKNGILFTSRDRKYKNGTNPNRAAGNGYWKATRTDKDMTYKGAIVGHRKAMIFRKT